MSDYSKTHETAKAIAAALGEPWYTCASTTLATTIALNGALAVLVLVMGAL